MTLPKVKLTSNAETGEAALYVDGRRVPFVSALVRITGRDGARVQVELDDVEVQILGELRAAVAAQRPTRFGDQRDEIVKLIEQGVSLEAISQRLILPRNEVLEVAAQLRKERDARMQALDEKHRAGVAAPPAPAPVPVVIPEPEPEPEIRSIHEPPTASMIRAWARSVGLAVPQRGLVQRAVVEAYFDAHPHEPRPVLSAQAPRLDDKPRDVAPPCAALPEGVTARDVRRWADGAGVACLDRGRIPRHVVEAYAAAHAEGAA